jgi:hypothetical protein
MTLFASVLIWQLLVVAFFVRGMTEVLTAFGRLF